MTAPIERHTKTTTILGGRFYDGSGEADAIMAEGLASRASVGFGDLLPPEALQTPSPAAYFGQEGYYEIVVTFVPTGKAKDAP